MTIATIDAPALLPIAVEHDVVFVPGAAFFASDSQPNTLRLNFSHPNPERIEEGVRRLARAMGEAAVR